MGPVVLTVSDVDYRYRSAVDTTIPSGSLEAIGIDHRRASELLEVFVDRVIAENGEPLHDRASLIWQIKSKIDKVCSIDFHAGPIFKQGSLPIVYLTVNDWSYYSSSIDMLLNGRRDSFIESYGRLGADNSTAKILREAPIMVFQSDKSAPIDTNVYDVYTIYVCSNNPSLRIMLLRPKHKVLYPRIENKKQSEINTSPTMVTHASITQFEESSKALLHETTGYQLSRPEMVEKIMEGLFALERKIVVPSLLTGNRVFDFVWDINGFHVRVVSGDNLTFDEKKAVAAYTLFQYAHPGVDVTEPIISKRVPYFSHDTIIREGLIMEPLDQFFTGKKEEKHAIILNEKGQIIGYLGLEAPLEGSSYFLGTKDRPLESVFSVEKIFGKEILSKLDQNLSSFSVSEVVEIRRLIPRTNRDGMDIPNVDRLAIAFILSYALANLVPHFVENGVKIAIADTDIDMLSNIFDLVLGVHPLSLSDKRLPIPQISMLPYPYNLLLQPRYFKDADGGIGNSRSVTPVVFTLKDLLKTDQVRTSLQLLLQEYGDAHSVKEKKEIMSKIISSRGQAKATVIQTSLEG